MVATFSENLAEVVKKYPCLHDKKDKDFKEVNKKEGVWGTWEGRRKSGRNIME